jgi:hypothetical protein
MKINSPNNGPIHVAKASEINIVIVDSVFSFVGCLEIKSNAIE